MCFHEIFEKNYIVRVFFLHQAKFCLKFEQKVFKRQKHKVMVVYGTKILKYLCKIRRTENSIWSALAKLCILSRQSLVGLGLEFGLCQRLYHILSSNLACHLQFCWRWELERCIFYTHIVLDNSYLFLSFDVLDNFIHDDIWHWCFVKVSVLKAFLSVIKCHDLHD